MKFDTAKQMLEYINSNHDLYSRKAETYVFNYNEAGSICTYDIDCDEAKELALNSKANNGEYWEAFLGAEGTIWDDPSYEGYNENQSSNLDRCASLIEYEDWVQTKHYLEVPINLNVELTTELTREDVDDIIAGALEGGINYWCCRAEVAEESYYGEYASEQISRGGSLRLYDAEEDKTYTLDLEKFIEGFKVWVNKGYDRHHTVTSGGVDCGNIDAGCADSIIQCALFGDIIYG